MDEQALALSNEEFTAYCECEATITHGLEVVREVARALLCIRDRRLYRFQFSTFEEYCEERWNISRPRAYQLIAAADVIENLSTMVDIPAPANERVARPLTPLPPAQQREAWTRAVKESQTGTPTAREVETVVNRDFMQVIQDKMAARRGDPPPTPEPKPDPADLAAIKTNTIFVGNVMGVIRAIETLSSLPLTPRDLAREIAKIDTPDKDWRAQSRAAVENLTAIVSWLIPKPTRLGESPVDEKLAELRKHLRERCDGQLNQFGIVYSDGVALACLDEGDEAVDLLLGLVQRLVKQELDQRSDLTSNGSDDSREYTPRKVRRPPVA